MSPAGKIELDLDDGCTDGSKPSLMSPVEIKLDLAHVACRSVDDFVSTKRVAVIIPIATGAQGTESSRTSLMSSARN